MGRLSALCTAFNQGNYQSVEDFIASPPIGTNPVLLQQLKDTISLGSGQTLKDVSQTLNALSEKQKFLSECRALQTLPAVRYQAGAPKASSDLKASLSSTAEAKWESQTQSFIGKQYQEILNFGNPDPNADAAFGSRLPISRKPFQGYFVLGIEVKSGRVQGVQILEQETNKPGMARILAQKIHQMASANGGIEIGGPDGVFSKRYVFRPISE